MKEETPDLRPYYNPTDFHTDYHVQFVPGEGVVEKATGRALSLSLPTTSAYNNTRAIGIHAPVAKAPRAAALETIVPGSFEKNPLADLELVEYFDLRNIKELLKSLLNSFVNTYIKTLISQPFDVTRILLQVGQFRTSKTTERGASDDESDEEDSLSFFSSSAHDHGSPSGRRHSRIERSTPRLSTTALKKQTENRNHIEPESLATSSLISCLLSKEGVRGLWRGINTNLMYTTLATTLEAWLTGFFSPLLSVPDPFFFDMVHSSNPVNSLVLSIFAYAAAALVLQPIDLIRIKFIATTTTQKDNKRSFRRAIASFSFKDFFCPQTLVVPTVGHALGSVVLQKYAQFILFTRFRVDRFSTPFAFHSMTLLSSVLEIFIRLPLETLLRRAQLHYMLKDKDCTTALRIDPDELSVKFGGYFGYISTLFYIYKGTVPLDEDAQDILDYEGSGENENRGWEALFRGWRVALVNVMSSWGTRFLRGDERDLREERF